MKNTIRELIIVGGSDQANVIYELCKTLNLSVRGFLDTKSPYDFSKFNLPVYNSINKIDRIQNYDYVAGIGHNFSRKCSLHELRCKLDTNHFPKLIHPSAIISPSSKIAGAVTIMANCYIDTNVSIEFGSLVNVGAIISHDVKLSEFSSIAPGVKIAGNVYIGRNTQVGIGVNIIEACKIGKNAVIGAGSTVVNDVSRNSLVYGTPAKLIKRLYPKNIIGNENH